MRHEQLSVEELTVGNIIGGGIVPLTRRSIYLDPTNGSDGGSGKSMYNPVKSLSVARSMILTGKGDRIVLVQGSSALSLTTDPLWVEKYTSLIGTGQGGWLGKRSRMTMASDYGTPMITLSGEGNLWQNLYITHGFSTTYVALVGLLISGNYNTLRDVHLSTPISSGLATQTGYRGLSVTAAGNVHFDHCVIGMDSQDRTGANSLVSIGSGSITTWEDCIFYTRISTTAPYFFEVLNTSGITRAFFKRCQFICVSTNESIAMAVAFTFTGGATCFMSFDSECAFMNVTELALSAQLHYIWTPRNYPAQADELNLIGSNAATY